MKRILYTLLAAVLALLGNYAFSNGTLEATVETSTPVLPGTIPTQVAISVIETMPADGPTPIPVPVETRDPYGDLYFTIITPKEYYPPETPPPYDENEYRLARLPGSCVVGLTECPEAETVETPFDMKDVYANNSSGITWSHDGRYGLLVTHPADELSIGKTKEELERIKQQSPSEFSVNASTIHMLDAGTGMWSEVYRAGKKFLSTLHWSPDGQWIAFVITNSPWAFHPLDSDDGIYIIHPDGSGLKHLGGMSGSILGWIGNSILLRQPQGIYPSIDYHTYQMEMLTLDGEIKPLFKSSRMSFYALAPDGGALLVADAQGESTGSPTKTVDLMALDGSVLHTFGTFTNYAGSIYPLAWSSDGSMIAFANLRRAYVGPRGGQGDSFPDGVLGMPPNGPVHEVYLADDTYSQPSFWNFQFSSDNKYLLMDVYEGVPHFVMVSLETRQAAPLEIKGMTESETAVSFSWRP